MGSNLLDNEQSPYLRQHKDNPVWWHPWSDAAFERARREDKPVFLSIGYSTCYWCHVMESDSFERQEVADVLNEHFVSIKVDREELPDVDQIYMDVVVAIHGHGGWPMSVFLTPDRKPFWGGTFFYRDQFIRILQTLAEAWRTDRHRIGVSSEELTRYLVSKQGVPGEGSCARDVCDRAAGDLLARFDRADGGFGGAPKFPPTQQLLLLMRYAEVTSGAAFDEAVNGTLDAMSCGGIFDQLGGGFHRYSVDAQWLIPHFEKMLYDNALLVPVFLEGFLRTGNERYRDVAARTLEYLLSEMRSPEGGFYSAEDAGEVGREGEFYVWTPKEVRELLGAERGERFMALYGVTEEGNFEHGTSALATSRAEPFEHFQAPEIVAARTILLAQRAMRPRPHRDEKIITGWNGLAITALCRGYQVLRDPRYRSAALQCASFIREKLRGDGRLRRRYCEGDARFDATLEDYAYLIQGLLALYQASGDTQWLAEAVSLQDEQHNRLWVARAKAYAMSAAPGNIVQMCEWSDGATPAPNGVSLQNVAILGALTGEPRFAQWGAELGRGIPGEAFNHPSLYCATLQGALLRMSGSPICAVVGAAHDDPPEEVWRLWREYLPLVTVIWSAAGTEVAPIMRDKHGRGGVPTFFLCQNQSCREPVVDVEAAVDLCSQASSFWGISA